jgi:O-acetyl-ADP-ribose deacetylase (regulator of RNase III)
VRGDITAQEVDAIVNAANAQLLPGGGVCGAIHRAAGPELAIACAEIGGCPTGQVRVTPGFRLPARYVIHAVGPVYRGTGEEAQLLASCYREALREAAARGLRSVAFPAISTGIYGYPLEEAARVALAAIADFLRRERPGLLVRMVLFGERDFEVHAAALRELRRAGDIT